MLLCARLYLAFSQQEGLDIKRAVFMWDVFGNLWGFRSVCLEEVVRMPRSCRDGSPEHCPSQRGFQVVRFASDENSSFVFNLITKNFIFYYIFFFFFSEANFFLTSCTDSGEFGAGFVRWERRRLVFSFVGRRHSVNASLRVVGCMHVYKPWGS